MKHRLNREGQMGETLDRPLFEASLTIPISQGDMALDDADPDAPRPRRFGMIETMGDKESAMAPTPFGLENGQPVEGGDAGLG